MATVLVTDSLFVGPAEEEAIRAAGYEIERLDKPRASEAELAAAVRGKVGYILGGIETVTDVVIDAADQLRVIAFTGSGYEEFIPGWSRATEKGIAISAARGANANSVADFALAVGLSLVRNLPAVTNPAGPTFYIAREFEGLTLGIVGLGHIGRALAVRGMAIGMRVLATEASSGSPPAGVDVVGLDEILKSADVISVHVSKGRGHGVLDREALYSIRNGGVVVNAAFSDAIDNEALLERVRVGDLRAGLDYHLEMPPDLPAGSIISTNAQTAFNTREANDRISARATSSLLNLLGGRDDPDLVNPDYARNRT